MVRPQAGCNKALAVDGREVEMVVADNAVAEACGGEHRRKLLAHLIITSANARPHSCLDQLDVGPGVGEHFHSAAHYATKAPFPSCMNGCDSADVGSKDKHRHAIGCLHAYRQARAEADKSVGISEIADGAVFTYYPYIARVSLPGPDDISRRGGQVGIEATLGCSVVYPKN